MKCCLFASMTETKNIKVSEPIHRRLKRKSVDDRVSLQAATESAINAGLSKQKPKEAK